MDELTKVVYAQDIADFYGVGLTKAKEMAKKTRVFYDKKRSEPIVMEQVKKANNLGV